MKTRDIYIRSIAVAITIFAFSFSLSAQTSLQKAKSLMASHEYSQAIDSYKEYFKTNPPTIENAREMAECYMMLRDTKSVEVWLSKVTSFDGFTANDVLNYANVLKSNSKYEEAMLQYKRYSEINPKMKDKADDLILSCKNSLEWIADPAYFNVINAKAFNSTYSEFGLITFNDGYIISSDRFITGSTLSEKQTDGCSGNAYFKLYYIPTESSSLNSPDSVYNQNNAEGISKTGMSASPDFIPFVSSYPEYNNIQLMDPVLISGLNDEYHNALCTFDKTTNTIYFTRAKKRRINERPINSDPTSWFNYAIEKKYTNFLEIYSAHYQNDKWFDIKPFQYNKASEYSIGHPAISPDGQVLYFASDMPGGYGKTDIYYSSKQSDGSWSKPMNAGDKINTEGEESYPYVDSEGMLYFSSDGHPGMGGLDIFSSSGSKDNWEQPVNLKYPINSAKDDFSVFYTDPGKSGYFASNRDGGKGEDDIYYFIPEPITKLILAGVVKQRLEDNSIEVLKEANIKMDNKTTNATGILTSNNDGKFYANLECNSAYDLTATKTGYFMQSKSLATTVCKTRNDTVFVDLLLDKIVLNKSIVLENIYYDFDKWNIRSDAALELDKLVDLLKRNPDIKIELGSHTDCRGSNAYNEKLSQKRAESAVAYIISQGINKDRITAKGYGESVPVNSCIDGVKCAEEQYQLNRRTEFKVTDIIKK
ncbi:MAG TPA: OmpA family protein [Bacteroidales bacterium]|nr:OmpA family protein [Bacteroidales bacterium]HPS16303.1 OmpA family protein [Bacteroidales bacterium]